MIKLNFYDGKSLDVLATIELTPEQFDAIKFQMGADKLMDGGYGTNFTIQMKEEDA